MNQLSKYSLTAAVALATLGATSAAVASTNLTAACEEALALSALPERLRDGAAAYTLTDAGFKLTRKGDGSFTCIVARNHETSIIPQCADAAGTDNIIPAIIQRSEWTLAGMQLDEQQSRFDKLVQEGTIRAPERTGINYMMSEFNFIWNAQREEIMHVGPHVMYYAPNVSNEQIGGSIEEAMGSNRGTPYILDEGIHGYITSFVEHPSSSTGVMAACKGQINAPAVENSDGGS